PQGGGRRHRVRLVRIEKVRAALRDAGGHRRLRAGRVRVEADILHRPVDHGRTPRERHRQSRKDQYPPSHGTPPCDRPTRSRLETSYQDRTYFRLVPSTVSLKVFATEKPTFLRAGMLIGSPVWGFRPTRAFIFRSLKMPRPGIFTFSPFFTVLTTVSTKA